MPTTIVASQNFLLDVILDVSSCNVDAMLSSFPATGPMEDNPSKNTAAVDAAIEESESLSRVIVLEHRYQRQSETLLKYAALVASAIAFSGLLYSILYL